jgi:acetyltransferase-like isoleucine patch superfamily enzyme
VTFLTHDGATWCFREQEKYRDVIRYGKITIYDNCFVGANVTILPNVSIGPNSIIGAGSVVTKDVKPNSVYAGCPAKFICSLTEYAEKCLVETPEYDKEAYLKDKKAEVLHVLNN